MPRTPIGWLNAVMPKDGGVVKAGRGISFGPDPRHLLDVYVPMSGGGGLPVLNFIYGGGWNSGSRTEYAFAGRAFAAAGFVTVIADYRVVPDVHFPSFLEDGGLVFHWIIEEIARFGGDPARIVMAGHSAGAYNAVMLGLDGERFGAPNLVGRLRGVAGLSGPYDFYPFDVRESIDAFSRAPEPLMTQPVNLVSAKAPPMFLAHGTEDTICLPRNTRALAARLREKGIETVERLYPDSGHAAPLLSLFPLFRWRLPVYREVVAFLRSQTGV